MEARFRRLDRRIVACIDRAREGWDISTGKLVVAFRIERSGKVVQAALPDSSGLE